MADKFPITTVLKSLSRKEQETGPLSLALDSRGLGRSNQGAGHQVNGHRK